MALPQLPKQKKPGGNSAFSFSKYFRRFRLPKLWKFKWHRMKGVKIAKNIGSKRTGSPYARAEGSGMPSFRIPGTGSVSKGRGRVTSRAPMQTRGGARKVGAPKR